MARPTYKRPYKTRASGLVWRVSGKAGVRPVRMQLLQQGRHKNLLQYRRDGIGLQLIGHITQRFYRVILKVTPFRRGRLRSSSRLKRNPWRVEQGPSIAVIDGRREGFYARLANIWTDYIRKGMRRASRQAQPLIRRYGQLRRNIESVDSRGINLFKAKRVLF